MTINEINELVKYAKNKKVDIVIELDFLYDEPITFKKGQYAIQEDNLFVKFGQLEEAKELVDTLNDIVIKEIQNDT